MRRLLLISLCSLLIARYGAAQSGNAAAGLAGIAAGAALSPNTNSGTTPSSIGGGGANGGSSPLEIQVMAFNGMQKIAQELAALVKTKQLTCTHSKLDTETQLDALVSSAENAENDVKSGSRSIQDIKSDLAAEIDKFVANMKVGHCQVLIQDSLVSNQLALYQTAEGYYEHLRELHGQLQRTFTLQPDVTILNFSATSGLTVDTQAVNLTNRGTESVTVQNVSTTNPAFKINTAFNFCDHSLNPNDSCSEVLPKIRTTQ